MLYSKTSSPSKRVLIEIRKSIYGGRIGGEDATHTVIG